MLLPGDLGLFTLDKLGVARPTFYRWYARCLARGEAG
jgi:hypothetical protein